MRLGIKRRWIQTLDDSVDDQLVGAPFLAMRRNGVWKYSALGLLTLTMNIKPEIIKLGRSSIWMVEGETCYLAPRVLALAGIGPQRGPSIAKLAIDSKRLVHGYDLKSLSEMGYSFSKLADIIEEQL
jgi:hypothetical protein